MGTISVAIISVGNCASSLVQGIEVYKSHSTDEFVPGIMHLNLGGYHPRDIEIAAALNLDADIKSQAGATVNHRVLTRPFEDRGVRVDRTYQLIFGGNTNFMNTLERVRLESKKDLQAQCCRPSYFVKSPPQQYHDDEARRMVDEFVAGASEQ